MATTSHTGWTCRRFNCVAGLALCGLVIGSYGVNLGRAADGEESKSIRKTCGSCPEGYATTGVTNAAELCKDGEPTLVQCVPLGGNILSVCGPCPEGYTEIGHSNVPSRCGSKDGGLLSQCQSMQMGSSMPDPSQGGIKCPPDCGSTAAPGFGAAPPPPKFRPAPEHK
jgi:hypothetical protein